MYTTSEVVANVMKRNKEDLIANCIMNISEDVKEKYTSVTTMIQHVCDMSSTEEDAIEIFKTVSSEMFSDGICNWGRISTVFVFAIALQERFNTTDFEVKLTETVVNTINEHSGPWIEANGGWIRISDFYFNPELIIRRTVMSMVMFAVNLLKWII